MLDTHFMKSLKMMMKFNIQKMSYIISESKKSHDFDRLSRSYLLKYIQKSLSNISFYPDDHDPQSYNGHACGTTQNYNSSW